jgi:hypothetical protein
MNNITIQAPVVHIHSVNPEDLTAIFLKLSQVLEGISAMTPELQALVDQVHANTSVTNSAVALIQGLSAMIAQAAAVSSDPVIAQLAAEIAAADLALSMAVSANTPAGPPAGVPVA